LLETGADRVNGQRVERDWMTPVTQTDGRLVEVYVVKAEHPHVLVAGRVDEAQRPHDSLAGVGVVALPPV
jgi:hypothetical protein